MDCASRLFRSMPHNKDQIHKQLSHASLQGMPASASMLLCPLFGILVVLRTITLIQLRNLRHQWVVGVAIHHQRRQREEHFGDRQSWAPLVFQNVQADRTIGIYVAMVDLRGEVELWRLEGIIRRKVNIQEEATASVRRIRGTHDGGLPIEHVVPDRLSRAIGRRVIPQILKLLLESLNRHDSTKTNTTDKMPPENL